MVEGRQCWGETEPAYFHVEWGIVLHRLPESVGQEAATSHNTSIIEIGQLDAMGRGKKSPQQLRERLGF